MPNNTFETSSRTQQYLPTFMARRIGAIRNPAFSDFRVIELVNMEASEQARWISGFVEALRKLDVRLAAAPGRCTVVDTNVLLHYQSPENVDWRTVTEFDKVRLILPLRVVEELDEKKYLARADLADRARRLLSRLWGQLSASDGGPAFLRDEVTIEVPIDDGPRDRPFDADQEILDLCEDFQNAGEPLVLVTSDTGMSLRALQRNVTVVSMPDSYLRKKPTEATVPEPASSVKPTSGGPTSDV